MHDSQKSTMRSAFRWLVLIIVGWLVVYPLAWLFAQPLIKGHTLQKLTYVLSGQSAYTTIADTLLLGLGVALFSIVVGTPLAWLTSSTDLRFRQATNALILLPLLLPPFVSAMAWIFLAGPAKGLLNQGLSALGLHAGIDIFSYGGLVWVIGLHTTPYVYLNVQAGLGQLDVSVEEASRAAGASLLTTLRRVTFPMLTPSIASGALLAFTVAVEMFGVPKLLGQGAGMSVLSLAIYDNLKYPPDYATAAIFGALLLIIVGVIIAVYRRLVVAQAGRYATVGVRGSREGSRIRLRWRNVISLLVVAFLAFAVVLPTVILFATSLLPAWTGQIDFGRMGLSNYRALLELGAAKRGFVNSIEYSLVAVVIALTLGTAVAHVSLRHNWRFRNLLDYLSSIPLALPGMALGVGLLIAYLRPPVVLYGTGVIMVLAYVTRYLGVAVRNSMGALSQIDRSMEEAASAAGARFFQVQSLIVLPLIARSVIGTSITVVAMIMREMSASILLYGFGTEVLSVVLFNFWETGQLDVAAAIGMVMSVLALALSGLGRGLLALRRTSSAQTDTDNMEALRPPGALSTGSARVR